MPMFDLHEAAPSLLPCAGGLWRAPRAQEVSYPADGHDACFACEDESFWFQHRNACLGEAVRAFPPSGPILDVGAGNGCVAQALRQAGWETVLLEAGRTGVDNALRRKLRPVIWAALEEAGFRPHCLPAVGLFDVLEHVADDAQFLDRIQRLLLPGGMLYLTVPACRWLWSAEDVRAGHYRRYNRGELLRLLTARGFRIRFVTHFFSFLPLPILVRRTLLGRNCGSDPASQQQQHRLPDGWTGRLLGRILDWERRRIARRKTLPLGSSCLLVAQTPGLAAGTTP